MASREAPRYSISMPTPVSDFNERLITAVNARWVNYQFMWTFVPRGDDTPVVGVLRARPHEHVDAPEFQAFLDKDGDWALCALSRDPLGNVEDCGDVLLDDEGDPDWRHIPLAEFAGPRDRQVVSSLDALMDVFSKVFQTWVVETTFQGLRPIPVA